MRLDAWLAGAVADLSRSRAKALIAGGSVAIGGATIEEPKRPVKPGERVTVDLPPPVPAEPEAEAIPLDVVYEDDDLIVIDKPAGLVVHPAAGNQTGTLVNALIAHCGGEPLRHRRRDAAGHRPPARQGHQRPDGGRQDRPRPSGPCRPVRRPRPHRPARARLPGAGLGGAGPAPTGTIEAPLGRSHAQPREDRGQAAGRAAARRSPTTASRRRYGPKASRRSPRSSNAGWRPAAPTRSASTWPRSAIR